MNHPERSFHDQLQRIERLLRLTQAKNHYAVCAELTYYDLVILTCQGMWNMKDWVLNDPAFSAADMTELKSAIYGSRHLIICSDFANGTKHFYLNHPKTNFSISQRTGVHFEPAKGIFQEFLYIVSVDRDDPLFGIESRAFLKQCRGSWQEIIDKHHLSKFAPGKQDQTKLD